MLMMIMTVIPILINDNYYSQNYYGERVDDGNDSDQWSVLVVVLEMIMMMMLYVRINCDEFVKKIAWRVKTNLNMCNWSPLH